MFQSVLIANRGEIACRIIATARRLALKTIAIYSDADASARHVAMADLAVRIGPAPAKESYLDSNAILEAAGRLGAEAIHPGYGFLSENAEFAERVEKAGIVWIGPPASAIRAMGLKDRAKALMEKAGVPIVPGDFGADQTPEHLARRAAEIGYPIMIKAVAGGGGKGMRLVAGEADFAAALAGAKREAGNAFGDDRMMLERAIQAPRHIEVQIFADRHGQVLHLMERDCSLQRRHQKVIEEAPAPGMTPQFRVAIAKAAIDAARTIGYVGAGTVEFIADGSGGLDPGKVYFLEMNTRLQVEHPVTEMILGLDLVAWQLRVAAGEPLPLLQDQIAARGHAMEARLYAEDPQRGFLPSTGRLERLRFPPVSENLRIDSGVVEGDRVTIHYDPMIAKIIAFGQTRREAARRLALALSQCEVLGVETNANFLMRLVSHHEFLDGRFDTGFIARHERELLPLKSAALDPLSVQLAILALVLDRRARAGRADPTSPFTTLDGFRPNLQGVETIRLSTQDEAIEAAILYDASGLALRYQDRIVPIAGTLDAEGTLDAAIDGVRHRAVARISGRRVHILIGESVAHFDLPDPLAAAAEEGAALDAIRSPMPGKVIEIRAKPGAAVKRGEVLAILEAMKMEHMLTAPADGEIDRVAVHIGDQVEDGAIIVAFKSGGP